MKELIEEICSNANVTPEQAKTILLLLKKHISKKHPLFAPAINKAFSGLDEKVDELTKEEKSKNNPTDRGSTDDYLD